MKGEILGVPQINVDRSQGKTPERNNFNLESEMIKNRGRGRRNSGNLQLSENVAHLVWLKIQTDGHESMLGALSGKSEGERKVKDDPGLPFATGRMVGLFSGKVKLQKVQAGHFGKSASDTSVDV